MSGIYVKVVLELKAEQDQKLKGAPPWVFDRADLTTKVCVEQLPSGNARVAMYCGDPAVAVWALMNGHGKNPKNGHGFELQTSRTVKLEDFEAPSLTPSELAELAVWMTERARKR